MLECQSRQVPIKSKRTALIGMMQPLNVLDVQVVFHFAKASLTSCDIENVMLFVCSLHLVRRAYVSSHIAPFYSDRRSRMSELDVAQRHS